MTFTHFCKCVKYQIITFASHNKDLTKKFIFSAQLDSHTEILFMQTLETLQVVSRCCCGATQASKLQTSNVVTKECFLLYANCDAIMYAFDLLYGNDDFLSNYKL